MQYRNPQTGDVHEVSEAQEHIYQQHGWEPVSGLLEAEPAPPEDIRELLADIEDKPVKRGKNATE